MVYSNLNSVVFYKENPSVDPEDIGHTSTLYEMDVLGKTVLIVLGKAKHTFIERNLVFYPIYLVANKDRKIKSQIGLVEVSKNRVIDLTDEEGDLDVAQLDPPLLFGFVNDVFIDRSGSDAQAFVEKGTAGPQEEEEGESEGKGVEEEEEEGLEEEEEDEVHKIKIPKHKVSEQREKAEVALQQGIFTVDPHVKRQALLPEESEEDANAEKRKYKSTSRSVWIAKFMKNANYDIHNVESNGDCFFAVVRDAFKQIGQITTVPKLRAILAKEATDDIFQGYRKLYLELEGTIREYDQEMRAIKNTLENVLKKRAIKARDNREELAAIMKETEALTIQYKEIQRNKAGIQELIAEGVGHFGDIDSLEKFREYIQTTNFWADAWAISVLERVLQIKMVILSERSYLDGNLDGVLDCGIVDKDIEKSGRFEPKFYIITTFSGDHYKLVSYKEKRIFEYSELPFYIKTLVINKCMERNSGAFYMITDFRSLKARMGIDEDEGRPREEEEEEDVGVIGSSSTAEYTPDIVFEFHAASGKTAKPGKGSNEKIPMDKRAEFAPLGQIPDWRKKLDDSWTEAPFKLEGHRWASVEHYYQGAKFKKHNPEFMLQFSLDSDSEISKDVDLARVAGGKTGKPVTAKQKTKVKAGMKLRPVSVEIDPDFYGERSEHERIIAVRAKFTQNEDMKHLLLATKNAKLIHFIRGSEPETDHVLMHIRRELRGDSGRH